MSRTTYYDLFLAIGTVYGAGDGSTTFNVPNFKGRVPVGLDSAQVEFDALSETGGAKTVALSTAELASHTHTVDPPSTGTDNQGAHTHNVNGQALGGAVEALRKTDALGDGVEVAIANAATSAGAHTHSVDIASFASGAAGSGTAHQNLQPYLVLNFIIKT